MEAAANYIQEYLKNIPWKKGEKEEFMRSFKEITVKQKTEIEAHATTSKYVYIVISGYLHSFFINEKGEEITTHIFPLGMFCLHTSNFIFQKEDEKQYIRTLTDCKLLVIKETTFQKLCENNFGANYFVRMMYQNAYQAQKTRLQKFILWNAKERYLWFRNCFGETLERKIPLKVIAHFLGIKPPSLSRIRKEL